MPFAGTQIPVLGPVELAVFKAMFDRTRDWADIEAMVAAGTLDVDAVGAVLRSRLGGTTTVCAGCRRPLSVRSGGREVPGSGATWAEKLQQD